MSRYTEGRVGDLEGPLAGPPGETRLGLISGDPDLDE